MTKRGSFAILSHVVARATTTAILENDIVNKDKQEQRVRDDREGESLSESEHRTVRFLRETTVLSERKRAEDCEGLNIRV